MRNHKKKKEDTNRKCMIVLLIILIILLIVAIGIWVYQHYIMRPDNEGGTYIEPNASSWDDGLDNSGEIEGRILVPGYSGAQMNEGDTKLSLRIGNPEENTCYLKATLQLEDGTVLYESGLIEPGKGFEEIELNRTLGAGSYEAVVHFQGYTMDDEPKELNSSDSAFTLTVLP